MENSKIVEIHEFGGTLEEVAPNKASGDVKYCISTDDNVKELKHKLAEAENKVLQLSNKLKHEKHKVQQLEHQMQFLKGNHQVLEKLQDVCFNLKEQKEQGSTIKTVEMAEKGVQTWRGMLCRACLETEKIRAQLEHVQKMQQDCLLIQPKQMQSIRSAMDLLKKYSESNLDDEEEEYTLTEERAKQMQCLSHQCVICGRCACKNYDKNVQAEVNRHCLYGRCTKQGML